MLRIKRDDGSARKWKKKNDKENFQPPKINHLHTTVLNEAVLHCHGAIAQSVGRPSKGSGLVQLYRQGFESLPWHLVVGKFVAKNKLSLS